MSYRPYILVVQKIIAIGGILCLTLVLSTSGGCGDSASTVYPPLPQDSSKWGASLNQVWRIPRIVLFGQDSGAYLPTDTHPLMYGGNLIFAYDTILHCVNMSTGSIVWTASSFGRWSPVKHPLWDADNMILEGSILYIIGPYHVDCKDANTGNSIWHFEEPNLITRSGFSTTSQSPIALFITTSAGELLAISKASGQMLWRVKGVGGDNGVHDPLASAPGPATFYNGVVYVGASVYPNGGPVAKYYGGAISAWDAETGAKKWKNIIPDVDATVRGYTDWKTLVSNKASQLIIANSDGLLFTTGFAVASADFDGNIRWRSVASINGAVSEYYTSPILLDGHFYVFNNGNGNGFSYSMNPQTGQVEWLQQISPDGNPRTIETEAPFITNGVMYKTTNDEWIFAQDIHTGTILWSSKLGRAEFHGENSVPFAGGLYVEGKRLYFLTARSILCMERK